MILTILFLHTILVEVFAKNDLSSSKRGLIAIASNDEATDDHIWNSANSDLTWYYNYGAYPTDGLDSSKLQFVPMLWGKPSASDTPFNDAVKSLIDGGLDIQYILTFNEPDLCQGGYGGSCVSASDAAQIWREQIEPLKKLGIKLGAPAVRGAPVGAAWLADFFSHCDGKCTADFLPLHWYGGFDGFPDYVAGTKALYKNISSVWITEFADPNASLESTQSFYNLSTAFLDDTSYVSHYSYFGSFRSDVSNVGPNVAMLDGRGQLTDIGAWYLGRHATGNLPTSDAPGVTVLTWWMALAVVVALLGLI